MIEERLHGPGGEPVPSPDPREMLRTSMNMIFRPPSTGLLPAFLEAFDVICDGVEILTRDANDADAQAWYRAAVATKQLICDHSESVKAEWLEAYGDLPPMKWPA